MIELQFPVVGQTVPTQNGYALYGAISRIVPEIHDLDAPSAIAPLTGSRGEMGELLLDRRSQIRIRLPAELIPQLLRLAGRPLELVNHRIQVGVPRVQIIEPSSNLYARIVLLKVAHICDPSPSQFETAVRKRLDEHQISATAEIPVHRFGCRRGQPLRRVTKISGRTITGYALRVNGLSAGDSIKLQEIGLGGRRKMGGGFFIPITKQGD